MAADLTRFSDVLNHQRESIDTAVNTVGMQIEALVEGQDVLAERLYHRSSDYSLGQHTETRNAMKLVALTVQADLNSILAEVQREVQGLHSKIDDAIVQKPLATERSIANQQVNLDESLAIFFQQNS